MSEADSNDPRGTFSRVSIDTRQHWRNIQESVRENAIDSLKKQLTMAGMQGKYDIFLPHVQAFVEKTLGTAKPNLRINGRNIDADDDDDQDDDQFDEVLDRKVWSLSAQRLKWDLEIANKRRTMPKDVELLMRQLKEQRDEQEAELLKVMNEPIEEDEEMEEGVANEDESYEQTMELLLEIKKDIPEQLERTRRFELADREIRSLKP